MGQYFEFHILHWLGGEHAIADYLSRLELGEEGTGVKDDFPNDQLFHVDTIATTKMGEDTVDAWITEMSIFLSIGLPTENMPLDERKRLAVRSKELEFLSAKRHTVP